VLKFFRPLQDHKHLWESGGGAPPIYLRTCQAEWLTSLPARIVRSQRQTGAFRFHLRLCVSCHQSVTLTDKHNTTDLKYRFYIQHYYMFRLSTSATIRLASVHTRNKMLQISPNKQRCKRVTVTSTIPYKRSNCMKKCISNFSGTIQCIGSNTNLECNIKQDKANIDKISSPKLHSNPCTARQCRIRHTV